MRSLKAVRNLALVLASLLLAAGLAACGGNAGGGNAGGSSVTGTVTWPDGTPAANAWVYFNDHETGFSGSGWTQHDSANSWFQLQLPADGSYSLPGCPCAYLTAYL